MIGSPVSPGTERGETPSVIGGRAPGELTSMRKAQDRATGEAAKAARRAPGPGPRPKQAVVLVHGMGEKRPMDTIKGFVEAVWRRNDAVTSDDPTVVDPNEIWTKPDARAGSLELRRITTRKSRPSPDVFPDGVRCDFYELYWADLTAATPGEEFVAWFSGLLWRWPWQAPRAVRGAWIALWALTVGFIGASVWAMIPPGAVVPFLGWTVPDGGSSRWLILAFIAGATAWTHRVVSANFGRVARYVRASPGNVAARQAVRERGLKLLAALTADPEYRRIILVGHSLGSVVAYDLIAFFWAAQEKARRIPEGSAGFEALKALEAAAAALERSPDDADALAAWTTARDALWRFMAAAPAASPAERWIISDFVTLGAPLAYADILMAADGADFARRKEARETPTAPPLRERLDETNWRKARRAGLPVAPDWSLSGSRLFSYPDRDEAQTWTLHHAAPFAVMRWTNIHDPASMIVRGDLISGPLRGVFGPAIRDVDLRALRGAPSGFTHGRYWSAEPAHRKAVLALQATLNLLDRPDPDPLGLNPWPVADGRPDVAQEQVLPPSRDAR